LVNYHRDLGNNFMSELNNCCGTTCDKQAAIAERDALVAQVETMKSLMLDLVEHVPQSAYPELYDKCAKLANESPSQHLREIQAKAGRAGFIAGAESMKLVFQYGGNYNTQDKANQYANRIRKGGE
jgi:phage I-like protein